MNFFVPERLAVNHAPDGVGCDEHAREPERVASAHELAVFPEPTWRRERHTHRRVVSGFDHVAIALQEHGHLVAVPAVDGKRVLAHDHRAGIERKSRAHVFANPALEQESTRADRARRDHDLCGFHAQRFAAAADAHLECVRATGAMFDARHVRLGQHTRACGFGPAHVSGQRAALAVDRARDVAIAAAVTSAERFVHVARVRAEFLRCALEQRAAARDVGIRSRSHVELAFDLVEVRFEHRELDAGAEPAPVIEHAARRPHHHHVRQHARAADAAALQDEHVHLCREKQPTVFVQARDHPQLVKVHVFRTHVRAAFQHECALAAFGGFVRDDCASRAGAHDRDVDAFQSGHA